MQDKFETIMSSDLDYEEMVADICYENQIVATITQENGIDKMEIVILPPIESKETWILPLDDFIKAIELAKKNLIKMTKLSED